MTDRSAPALEARGLRKRYPKGDRLALDDVSLSLVRGERLSLLGPSGSGKSTLLNTLAGFLNPDSGQVLVDGVDITTTPTSRRNLGMVFQSFALFPHLTVAQNVEYGLRVQGVGGAERARRRTEALELVAMGAFTDRRPKQLSGGQQQRIAFARAIVGEPKVLLLDEPFAALDTALRRELRDQLVQVQARVGITSVLVTHDQEEALSFGDRVAVLRDGAIQQVADPETLYSKPASTFVAGFLGSCSFVDAVIAGVSATSTAAVTAEGRKVVLPFASRLDVGAKATIGLRPEWVTLDESDASDAVAVGRVVRRDFLGTTVEYRLDIGADELLRVTLPSADAGHPATDQEVAVRIRGGVRPMLFDHTGAAA